MGALAGFAAGNVPGAVAGYLGGVNAADGVTSGRLLLKTYNSTVEEGSIIFK